ncbi:hypothetical protein MRX96_029752 [Rhipicephalus microplus]
MHRARNRTLRLTIIIVLAFFLCWTPYVTMVLWYQIDPSGAEHVNGYLQSSLFMFAVSNSCVNPLVYGSYTKSFKRILALVCCWIRKVQGGNYSTYAHASTRIPRSEVVCRKTIPDVVPAEAPDDHKPRCLVCVPPANNNEIQLELCQPATNYTYASVPKDTGDCSVLWKVRSYSAKGHRKSAVTVLQNGDTGHGHGGHVEKNRVRSDPCSL